MILLLYLTRREHRGCKDTHSAPLPKHSMCCQTDQGQPQAPRRQQPLLWAAAASAQHWRNPEHAEVMQLHHRTRWTCSWRCGCWGAAAAASTRREGASHPEGRAVSTSGGCEWPFWINQHWTHSLQLWAREGVHQLRCPGSGKMTLTL